MPRSDIQIKCIDVTLGFFRTEDLVYNCRCLLLFFVAYYLEIDQWIRYSKLFLLDAEIGITIRNRPREKELKIKYITSHIS